MHHLFLFSWPRHNYISIPCTPARPDYYRSRSVIISPGRFLREDRILPPSNSIRSRDKFYEQAGLSTAAAFSSSFPLAAYYFAYHAATPSNSMRQSRPARRYKYRCCRAGAARPIAARLSMLGQQYRAYYSHSGRQTTTSGTPYVSRSKTRIEPRYSRLHRAARLHI